MPKSHTHMHQHLQMPHSRVELHTLARELAFEQVTIIGNASGNWQPATTGTTFIFNGTQWNEKSNPNNQIVNIANGGFAESKYAFVVQGYPQNDLLTQALTQVAIELTPQLGCWPSSGLTTIVLMQQLSQHVQVQRMSLFPSLARPNDLPPEDHLPCMVHNWLGERRIAQTFATALDWPEFTLSPVFLVNLTTTDKERGSQTSMVINSGNPFDLLARLQEANPSTDVPHSVKHIQFDWLIALAHTPIDIWLKYADLKQVINAEALFFNHMPESKPSYWYLMDTQASQYLDAIRHSLAYCWQTLSTKQNGTTHTITYR
ncbi:hypothetical protein [Shewanella baltica]|uniref:hypothetical protein n=1 Tax=Shewanella baltica TaxID=62322 RepID=UPI000D1A13A7|nr:hypothetical protein [Shewanella baltica]AVT49567.1 hypothetical protein C8I07_18595 [Shewanella baltica]